MQLKIPKLPSFGGVGRTEAKKPTKIFQAFIVASLLLSYFTPIMPFLTDAKADSFYPGGNNSECHFASTVAVGYDSLGGGEVHWNSAQVSGYSRNWIDSNGFLSVATPYYPDARRYPSIADAVAVPPNTRVSVAFYGWSYAGHTINVPQVDLFNSRQNSHGGVTRLGAGGTYSSTCWNVDGMNVCRNGMRVSSSNVGSYPVSTNIDGKIIHEFNTIQPVTRIGFTGTPIWNGENLQIRYDLSLRNNSSYNLCNIRVRDTMPSGQTYDQTHCINAGQTSVISYYENWGTSYPMNITNNNVRVDDNNSHTETTAEAMTWAGDNRPEVKTSIAWRDDLGSPSGWSETQASWGQQSNSLYQVTLIPYWFEGGNASVDLTQDVSITKTVSDSDETNVTHNTARNREELTYTITVTNNEARVQNMNVIDDYNEDYLTILDPDGGVDNGDTLTWTTDLEHGQSRTWSVKASIIDLEQGDYTFTNTARTESPDAGPVETITNVSPQVIISLDKTVSDSDEANVKANMVMGDHFNEDERKITFTVQYSNTGDADAHNVTLTDNLTGFYDDVLVHSVENISGGGIYDSNSHIITWNLGDLGDNESGSQTFDLILNRIADYDRIITNQAEIDSDQTLPIEDTTETTIVTPALEIVKTDNTEVAKMGDTLTYEVTITNNGTGDAYNLIILDTLPEYVEVVSGSISDGGTYNGNTRTITWENEATPEGIFLNSGDSYMFTFEVLIPYEVVTADTTLVNISTVKSPTIAEIEAEDTTNVIVPILTVNKLAIEPEPITPTSVITYQITVRNNGSASAREVIIKDNISTRLEVLPDTISHGGTYDNTNRIITWTIGELESEQEVVRTFQARIVFGEELSDNDVIENQAEVYSLTNAPIQSEVISSQINCGYLQGIVWEDSNKDAVIDEGELRIPNAEIQVTVEDFEKYGATFVSDKNGHYVATCLPFEKEVYVDITRPAGYAGQSTVNSYVVKLSQSGQSTIYELSESGEKLFVWAGNNFDHADLGLFRSYTQGSVLGISSVAKTGGIFIARNVLFPIGLASICSLILKIYRRREDALGID
ncbi:DUF11 domain-containing protein [Candidatus Dojkabacteria bacterium]|nr:DUF11 domain-containing protein [Candidatus Dojkabacteria bacterium]